MHGILLSYDVFPPLAVIYCTATNANVQSAQSFHDEVSVWTSNHVSQMLNFTSVFSSRLCVISIKAAISHPHTIATTLVVSTEAPPTWCSNLFMRRSQSESGGGELDQLESKRRGWNEGNTDGDYFELEILRSHSTKAWEKKSGARYGHGGCN